MRAEFSEYYPILPAELNKLWQDCFFSFDASVLLNVYRYSEASRDQLFSFMQKVEGRIWITHQAALEFHKNRVSVITQVHQLPEEIEKSLQDVANLLSQASKQHPYLTSEVVSNIQHGISSALIYCEKARMAHPDLLRTDEIRDKLNKLLEGKIGDPYAPDKLKAQHTRIAQRYEQQVPPGYADVKNKSDDRRFGDCLIWFQLIDYARENKKPIILVTGERKDDWWLKHSGQILQPRPELRKEFRDETGQAFYMYEAVNFLQIAGKQLKLDVPESLILEAKTLEEEAKEATHQLMDENMRRFLVGGLSSILREDTSKQDLNSLQSNAEKYLAALEELRTVEESLHEAFESHREGKLSGNGLLRAREMIRMRSNLLLRLKNLKGRVRVEESKEGPVFSLNLPQIPIDRHLSEECASIREYFDNYDGR